MKRIPFYFRTNKSILMLLIVMFSLLMPTLLRGQPSGPPYIDDHGGVIATEDTRIIATIVENDTTVQLQIMGMGYCNILSVIWSLVYDSAQVYLLKDDGITPVIDDLSSHQSDILSIDPVFAGLHPTLSEEAANHKVVGNNTTYKQLVTDIGIIGIGIKDSIEILADNIQKMYTINFRKRNANVKLTSDVFGYQVVNLATDRLGIGINSIYSVNDAIHLSNFNYLPASFTYHTVVPDLFVYRSPSWVITDSADNITKNSADLVGNFSKGDFASAFDVLRVVRENNHVDDGRLTCDEVDQAGFIYTKANVHAVVNEYTRTLTVGGTDCSLPHPLNVTTFNCGGVDFYITEEDVSGMSGQTDDLNHGITGLDSATRYYAWAYIDYNFENSASFVALGKRIDFRTLGGSDFDLECASDTVINLPYGMSPADIVLSQPVILKGGVLVTDSIRDADYIISNNYPDGFPTNGGFTVEWKVIEKGATDSVRYCQQLVAVNYPECGENDTVWKIESGAVVLDKIRTPLVINDAEGNSYSTVRICYECWTAENMVTTEDSLGISIDYSIYEARMYPNTDTNKKTYGYLYDAETATSICPSGWELPSVDNYECLIPFGSDALRQPGSWLQDHTATNSTGFSALPGGYYKKDLDMYMQLLGDAYFWTSSSVVTGVGQVAHIRYICPVLQIENMDANNGASVRCIKVHP